MKNHLKKLLSAALSVMFAGQMLVSSGAFENIAYAEENGNAVSNSQIIYASNLTIHGYAQKGSVDRLYRKG